MKRLLILGIFVSFQSSYAIFIKSLDKQAAQIDVSSVHSAQLLFKSESKNINIRLVTRDYGLSTDVSNRYQIYVTGYSANESNNYKVAFDLGAFLSVSEVKQSQGTNPFIFEFSGSRLNMNTFDFEKVRVQFTISDAIEDLMNASFPDFSDPYIQSQLSVSTHNL